MFNRAPVYIAFVLAACTYLFAADLLGWSPLYPFLPKSTATRGAPIRHK